MVQYPWTLIPIQLCKWSRVPWGLGALQLQGEGTQQAKVLQHGGTIFSSVLTLEVACFGSCGAYCRDLPVSTLGGFLSELPFLSLMRLCGQGPFPVLITHYQLQSCC